MKRCPGCAAACLDAHRHCPTCGADVSRTPIDEGDPFVGTTLAGKYQLNELIGVGAMGRVYRGDHLALDAQVAIKVLNAETASDQQTARRFQTEARAASRLKHPNTIQIIDFGQAESGALYIVMELLRGQTLARIIEDSAPLGSRRIVDLLGQALTALDEAHAAGVIHRDFKPENIFVEMLRTGREHIKVLDFGIAKLRGDQDANLTSRGAVCGTPEYMSPEQIRGEPLDARSDVYAAGVVLYEMLTGVRPFENRGPAIEVLTSHLQVMPEPPSKRRPEAGIAPAIEQVCLRAMSKGKEQRYRSAAELKSALEASARGISGEHCAVCLTPLPATARYCQECGAVIRASGSFSALKDSVTGGMAPQAPASQRPLPSLPLPLIGRDAVLDRLDGLDRDAVLVVGDPGMGKSAVADEWARRREAEFKRVVFSSSDPSGAAVPLYPVRRAVAHLLSVGERPSSADLERALGEHAEDRAGMRELFGFGGAASGLPLDVRRRECEAAALGVMRRSGASLVFEDAHLYDAPSRLLLAQLVAVPGEATVLVTAQHPEALPVEIEVVRLGPLDPNAFDALVRMGLPPGMAELTGGVPLLLVEWLRARHEEAPEATLAARLAVLPEAARAVLDAAAVAGAGVATPLLAQIAGVPDPGRAIAELALRGFVRTGGARVRTGVEIFSPTLRERVYAALSDERQQALHVALAKALHERGDDPIVVAHHAHLASGAPSVMLERAGDAAREGFDDDASARWYRLALDRGRQALAAGKGDEARQIRIALKLGLVQRYRGELLQSEQVLREALDLSVTRGDRWAEVQARRGLARLALNWHNLDGARDQLVAAVTAALGGGDRNNLAELYVDLADTLARLGDPAGGERELWEGMMLVTGGDGPEATSGPDPLWRMLHLLAELARGDGRAEQARGYALHALRHAERLGSPVARARVHALLGSIFFDLDRTAQAAEHRRAAVEAMRDLGDRRATAELLLLLADPGASPPNDARAWLKEADALAHQVGWQEGVARSRAALAQLG